MTRPLKQNCSRTSVLDGEKVRIEEKSAVTIAKKLINRKQVGCDVGNKNKVTKSKGRIRGSKGVRTSVCDR